MSDLKQRQDHRVPDLAEPSVEGLVYLLRHRELWPAAFVGPWNYAGCRHCAMGLAHAYWPAFVQELNSGSVADAIGMNRQRAREIFCGMTGRIMPEHVANELAR